MRSSLWLIFHKPNAVMKVWMTVFYRALCLTEDVVRPITAFIIAWVTNACKPLLVAGDLSDQIYCNGGEIIMARNLLWFKVDVNFDTKIKELVREYGGAGGFTFIVLLQNIYGNEGYYCVWNKTLCAEIGFLTANDEDTVDKIVQTCADKGLFDRAMFEKHQILTSHGIQYRYYDCASRRKEGLIRPEYLLLSENEIYRTKAEREERLKKEEKSLSFSSLFLKEKEEKIDSYIEKERQFLGLSVTEIEHLKSLCDDDTALLLSFLKKAGNWARAHEKVFSKPYAELKKWIEEYKTRPEKINKQTSYDLDQWEEFAMNFDPTEGMQKHQPDSTDEDAPEDGE